MQNIERTNTATRIVHITKTQNLTSRSAGRTRMSTTRQCNCVSNSSTHLATIALFAAEIDSIALISCAVQQARLVSQDLRRRRDSSLVNIFLHSHDFEFDPQLQPLQSSDRQAVSFNATNSLSFSSPLSMNCSGSFNDQLPNNRHTTPQTRLARARTTRFRED